MAVQKYNLCPHLKFKAEVIAEDHVVLIAESVSALRTQDLVQFIRADPYPCLGTQPVNIHVSDRAQILLFIYIFMYLKCLTSKACFPCKICLCKSCVLCM